MNNHIKNLLLTAGLMALGVTSANAAFKNTIDASGSALGQVFNTEIRFGDAQLLSSRVTTMNTFSRYMNGNFNASGNVLMGTGSGSAGQAWVLNGTTGASVDTSGGANANIRSVVYAGGNYFWGTGSGNINGASAVSSGSPTANAVASGTVSLVTDGTFVYAGGSGDDQIRKYSVSGTSLTQVGISTTSVGADPRGIQYHNGRIYVSSGSGGDIFIYNASDLSYVGPMAGNSANGFNNEGFSIFSMGGKDWFIGGQGAGAFNALVVRELTSFDTVSATADFYRYAVAGGSAANAFDLIENNGGLTGLSINAANGIGYFGSNGNGGIYAYDVTFVAVPEPSTYAMLALGLAMSAYGLRVSRRNKKQVANNA